MNDIHNIEEHVRNDKLVNLLTEYICTKCFLHDEIYEFK